MVTQRTGDSEPLQGLGGAILAAAGRAGLGVVVCTEEADGERRQYVSGVAAGLLGCTPDELQQLPRETGFDTGGFTQLSQGQAQQMPTGTSSHGFDAALLRKDGTRMSVRIATRAAELDGRPTAVSLFFGTAERHRAEQQLQSSELRFRSVIEAAPERQHGDAVEGDHRR